MHLGELLVKRGLVTPAELEQALRRQRAKGGRLGANLIDLGLLTEKQLHLVLHGAPAVATDIADTGVSMRSLLGLMLKFMHVEGRETVLDLAGAMKLSRSVIQRLFEEATQQRLVQAMGASNSLALSVRYALSEMGRAAAREAMDQCQYLGPAPVSLAAYCEQIDLQSISNEQLDATALRKGFEGLVVPEHYIRKLLPALSSGRGLLLFGPPGNGKTTLATRISKVFKDTVHIPYAVEVSGQIIKVYDPNLHQRRSTEALPAYSAISLRRSDGDSGDERWVPCARPVAVAGGEMTLDMLDLRYSSDQKYYDAPLQVKSLNGMLLIDDFGRQTFKPEDLLNRWIVPMENQIDFLKLHTGASFTVPFDVLLVFSTNLSPSDLMDGAFLRRIRYKIKLFSPNIDEYRAIFDGVAHSAGLSVSDDVFDFIVERLGDEFGLAYYQPKFICEQVIEACKCYGQKPELTRELAAEALANLYVDIEDAQGA